MIILDNFEIIYLIYGMFLLQLVPCAGWLPYGKLKLGSALSLCSTGNCHLKVNCQTTLQNLIICWSGSQDHPAAKQNTLHTCSLVWLALSVSVGVTSWVMSCQLMSSLVLI